MSDNTIRRRIPIRRRTKPPHPSPSVNRLHRKATVVRRSSNTQPKFIKRCNSEPSLPTAGITIVGPGVGDDHQCMSLTAPGESCVLFSSRGSTDVFASSPELLPDSYENNEGYNKDAKVVIKVAVEGSVGPIRALVKLGSSVDETIKLVMNKYNTERRSPRLDQDGTTSFELHHSDFSLHCLDKSNVIGEIGSRSFYMRKSIDKKGNLCSTDSTGAKIDPDEADEAPSSCSSIFLLGIIHKVLEKMMKTTSSIRRFLGCFDG